MNEETCTDPNCIMCGLHTKEELETKLTEEVFRLFKKEEIVDFVIKELGITRDVVMKLSDAELCLLALQTIA